MKLISTLFFSFITIFCLGQTTNILEKPKVDKRVELLSIVFRLAGSQEYSSEDFKLYTDKIEDYYSPYKNHELIDFIKELRKKEAGVGYDAVMKMAIHLDNQLNPLVEFTDEIPDKRWGKDNADKFVRLLKKFYKDTNSKKFFNENSSFYTEINKRFLPVYEHLDLNWYTQFYGKEPNEEFIIVNGLGNGGGNYGPSIELPNGERKVYAIMGTWETDSLNMAKFTLDYHFPTLLHEFNHSFVNYLLEKNPEPYRKSGEKIFEFVKSDMESQAYRSWETMFNEALVRTAVIKYMKDHNFDEKIINEEIIRQKNRGFVWIEQLLSELEKYDNSRDIYPTLESYMPNIAKAYITYANEIEDYIKEYDEGRPKVISIDEFKNGDQEVSGSLNHVTINFDKPLLGKGQSVSYGDDKNAVPKFKSLKYSEDKKTIIIEWELEDNKNYEFVLTGLAFKTPDGISMNDYKIKFKTK